MVRRNCEKIKCGVLLFCGLKDGIFMKFTTLYNSICSDLFKLRFWMGSILPFSLETVSDVAVGQLYIGYLLYVIAFEILDGFHSVRNWYINGA